jgi:hypothetical protein
LEEARIIQSTFKKENDIKPKSNISPNESQLNFLELQDSESGNADQKIKDYRMELSDMIWNSLSTLTVEELQEIKDI